MKSDPLAKATTALERAIADSGDVDASPAGRDEAIERIADALRRRRSATRKRRFAIALAAAVVLAAAGIASRRGETAKLPPPPSDEARVAAIESTVTAVRNGTEAAPAPGERLRDGTELRTPPNGEANLDFESGSHLTVGAASRVRLVEQTRHKRFDLETGSLRAKVAKLTPDERFVVSTPDSEIEVRGTDFLVTIVDPDPACGEGSPTRVAVREGVVVVRHGGGEERLVAGEHWPRCEPTVVRTPEAPFVSAPPISRPAPRPSASVEPASRLVQQNDLFQEAMRRKRSGDVNGALEALDRLRTTYADGQLAENADVERFRILASRDRAQGAAAARDYLRAHPGGFARAEAESLAASAP